MPMNSRSWTEANMLYGEALLYLDGPSRDGESAMLVAQAIEQTKRVQPEVLNALARTWPLDMATHRFQDRHVFWTVIQKLHHCMTALFDRHGLPTWAGAEHVCN